MQDKQELVINASVKGKRRQPPLSAPKQEQKRQEPKKQEQKKQEPKKQEQKKQNPKYTRNKKNSAKTGGKKKNAEPIKISFLGGLNEVGKNITAYEYNNEMILVDCGMAFPDSDMLGVDLVLPDFTYVEKNVDKLKGIVITHGHEDHIGGLPYLLKQVNVPIYATRLTVGLIQGKLKEHHLLEKTKLIVTNPGDIVHLGAFDIEFIHVNHSIPDAVGLAIRCDGGTIVQTGDFKIDTTPIDGEVINLSRFAQIGNEGVLCMLSDSTNAERAGYTESERKVGESFENLFRRAGNRRLIVATFASNIHRVQQIMNVAQSLGKKVALSGRSLENVVGVGTELGYLNVPEGLLVSIDLINKYPPEKMVIITTGSQGEPMSALTRMAFSDHRKVEVGPNDYVIISATPIPGNEKTVSRVVNELMKLGAEVVYEKMYEVHVSGHACQEELKMMMSLVKPKYFIPVHGEQKHLHKHAMLAESMGFERKNILIADIGKQVEVSQNGIKAAASVPSGMVYVDGSGVGDVGSIVLRDRKHLAEDGIFIVIASIESDTGCIVSGPDIVTRGFVYVREAEQLLEDAKKVAINAFEEYLEKYPNDSAAVKSKVRDELSRFIFGKTRRSPMILPIIMEV